MARGPIFKKGDGWAFRVDAGISAGTGKRRQMLRQGFKTKREAETALAAAQQSVEHGSVVSKSSMKIGAFLDQRLASQQGRLKASTHHSCVVTSKRIRSRLGREVTPEERNQVALATRSAKRPVLLVRGNTY
jgi:hypothetical protein